MMIALLASLLLAAGAADALQVSAAASLPDRSAFEAELKFSGEGEMLRAIERSYPTEYRALIDAIHADAAAHPGDRPARAATRRRLLDAFYKRRAAGLANAPAPLLNAINSRQLALIKRLARDDFEIMRRIRDKAFHRPRRSFGFLRERGFRATRRNR